MSILTKGDSASRNGFSANYTAIYGMDSHGRYTHIVGYTSHEGMHLGSVCCIGDDLEPDGIVRMFYKDTGMWVYIWSMVPRFIGFAGGCTRGEKVFDRMLDNAFKELNYE